MAISSSTATKQVASNRDRKRGSKQQQAKVLGAIKWQQEEAANLAHGDGNTELTTCYPACISCNQCYRGDDFTKNPASQPPVQQTCCPSVMPKQKPQRENHKRTICTNNQHQAQHPSLAEAGDQKDSKRLHGSKTRKKMADLPGRHRETSAGTTKIIDGNNEKLALENGKKRPPTSRVSGIRPLPVPESQEDCAKCQLIVRWTAAQAKLANEAAMAAAAAAAQQATRKIRGSDHQLASVTFTNDGCTSHHQQQKNLAADDDQYPVAGGSCYRYRSKSDYCLSASTGGGSHSDDRFTTSPTEDEGAEISSLTETNSSTGNNGQEEFSISSPRQRINGDDKWSLSSCCDEAESKPEVNPTGKMQATKSRPIATSLVKRNPIRQPSLRRQRLAVAPQSRLTSLGLRKRRPAPLPPVSARPTRRPAPLVASKSSPTANSSSDNSFDSGNTSGVESSNNNNNNPSRRPQRRPHPAAAARVASKAAPAAEVKSTGGDDQEEAVDVKPNLLTEPEVLSIEHFLRSHKSSVYVCGCMANLYLTSTNLSDNGRCSKPASEGWQLNKTGVPVLTFDSGLTKNRSKRRLSINLTERGSGFVLWSDIIDHLSNYRAYCAQIHGGHNSTNNDRKQQRGGGGGDDDDQRICETFHVMYLSTNHRIMVGLSFDDAKCARLFLKQVEMVTSDPQNIALTGPKLSHRLVSVSKLKFLRASGDQKKTRKKKHLQQDTNTSDPDVRKPEITLVNSNMGASWVGGGNCGTNLMMEPHSRLNVNQLQVVKDQEEACRSSRLGRLMLSGSRRLSYRAARTMGQPAAAGDYTWSTLKRAIRFGHQARALGLRASPDGGKMDNSGTSSALESAFVPKPLASLAMAGKNYRAGKKLPRKCDISAPCLFQHVTRVDLSNLDKLYTRSLVGAQPPAPIKPAVSIDTNSSTASDHLKGPEGPDSWLDSGVISKKQEPAEQLSTKLSATMISSRQPNSSTSTATSISSSQSSSSTSCYSSASISPVSSEYEHQQQQFKLANNPNNHRRPNHLVRPLPPRVPQASSGGQMRQLASQQQQLQSQQKYGQNQPPQQQRQRQERRSPSQPAPPESKIRAIIRDLQAQTSAELVEAKRKLMADIANQVVARSVSHL